MPKTPKATPKPKPEQDMTQDDAALIARDIAARLEGHPSDEGLAQFLLLLRYLSYRGDETERENVYIWTEMRFAYAFEGVEEAIEGRMRGRLAAVKKCKDAALPG